MFIKFCQRQRLAVAKVQLVELERRHIVTAEKQ